VEMANSTEYGLGCSIFTTNYTRADRVARQIESGMVSINDFGMVPMIQSLPFGGCKKSGFGHFNGFEGLRGFSRTQAVVTDRFPFRLEAPKFLQYPHSPHSHLIVQEGVRMIYGKSWLVSARSLINLLKLLLFAPGPEVISKLE